MTTAKKITTAKAAHQPVEAALAAGKETIETVVKAGAEAASKGVERAVAMSREHVTAAVKAGTEAFKSYEDIVSFGKDNVDAVVKTNAILVKGMQDIHNVLFGIAQAQLEGQVAATKKLLGCKTFKDVMEAQADLARISYAKALDDSRKITDLSVKLAEEATQPITKRVNVTVEKFSKPLAA
ncbi:MAG: phasin family protein [Rhodospirillales bacterium]